MDFALIQKVKNTGNSLEDVRGAIPSELPTDLPSNVVKIEQNKDFVITGVQFEGERETIYLENEVIVFLEHTSMTGCVSEFEIVRNSIRGHTMFVIINSQVLGNQPTAINSDKYRIIKKTP